MKTKRSVAFMMASILTLTSVGNTSAVFASDLGVDVMEDVSPVEEESDVQENVTADGIAETEAFGDEEQVSAEGITETGTQSQESVEPELSSADSAALDGDIIAEDVQVFESDLSASATDSDGQEDTAEFSAGNENSRTSSSDFEVGAYDVWFEEGMRGDGYSWVYTDELLTCTLNTGNLSGISYMAEWTVGNRDGDGNFTYMVEDGYAISEDGSSITLDGSILSGLLQDGTGGFEIHVAILAEGNEISSGDLWLEVREPYSDYQFPSWGTQLPGWEIGIDSTYNCYVENKDYPYGANIEIAVTDIAVAVEDGAVDAVTYDAREDGTGWDIQINSYGHAVATLQYNLYDGTPSPEPYVYDIWVSDDFYEIGIDSITGIDQVLPGASIDLYANVVHQLYDGENGQYNGGTGDVTVEWGCVTENWQEVVEIAQDTDDQMVLHVNALPGTGGRNVLVRATAYIPDENGGVQEVASCDYWVYVNDGYWNLEVAYEGEAAGSLPGLEPGESVSVVPALKLYSGETPDGAVTEETVQYRWEWDTDAVEITDAGGKVLTGGDPYGEAPFTLRKLGNGDTWLDLVAELPDEGGNYYEAARTNIYLSGLNYDIWFEDGMRDGGQTWLYTDEDLFLSLNTGNLTGVSYTVEWTAGHCDEEGNFYYTVAENIGYTVGEDGNSITLHGDSLLGEVQEGTDGFNVRAVIKVNGMEVSQSDTWVSVREPYYDYQFPGWGTQIPGWDFGIDSTFNCYVEDKDYPYGENVEVQITDLAIDVVDGAGDAVTYDTREDGSGWDLHMNSYGHAVVTMQYTLVDGSQSSEPYTADIYVGNDFYEIGISSSTDTDQLLPEASLDLTADVVHNLYDEENGHYHGTTEDVTIKWAGVTDDWQEVVSIETDPENQNVLHVTALPESSGRNALVRATAYVPDENGDAQEVSSCDYWIYVNDSYWKLELSYAGDAAGNMPNLAPGDSITVVPALNVYDRETPDGSLTDETVQYRWEWDSNAVEITDADGNVLTNEQPSGEAPFTLRKLENWTTDLNLIADLTDGDGNNYEAARCSVYLEENNYDIWFEDGVRGDGNTWVYTDEKLTLTLNTENLPNSSSNGLAYEIEWTVGNCDNDGNFVYTVDENNGYTVNGDGSGIVLKGESLAGLLTDSNDGFNVRAVVLVNGEELSNAFTWVHVREPYYDYQLPEWGPQFPGWSIGIDRTFNCYVEDKDHPWGENVEVQITNLTVTVDDGEEDAVTYDVREDGSGWDLQMNSFCHAVLAMEYTLADGSQSEEPYIVNLWVVDDFYDVAVVSDTGADQILPGASMDLTAHIFHNLYDGESGQYYGATDNAVVEWSMEDGDWQEVISAEPDEENPNVLHVTAQPDAAGRSTRIRASVYLPNDDGSLQEAAYCDYWVNVNETYWYVSLSYEGDNAEQMPNLNFGESVTVIPQLLLYSEKEPTGAVTDESVQYRFKWDTNAVTITDGDGKVLTDEDPVGKSPFTFTRLGNWDTWLNVIAELQNEDGSYYEAARNSIYMGKPETMCRIYYHEDDLSSPSDSSTLVQYGQSAVIESIDSLGFGKAGYEFGGWKIYRATDNAWYAIDKQGNCEWVSLSDGQLPDNYSYCLLDDYAEVSDLNFYGEIHLYAQWNQEYFTIYYHEDDSTDASSQTTQVTYGTTTPTLKISELGYSTAGRVFKGWKVYRSDTKCWRVVDRKGVQSWATSVPDGGDYYLYTDGISVARTANVGAEVHFYAQWEEMNSFTVYYHSSDSAAASKQTTEVTYGTTTPTLKVSELGYSTAGRVFKGWKVYRSDTKCWRVVDKKGVQSWATTVPDGGDYYLYTDGVSVARTANVGAEVHFYAQWEETNSFTVYYHSSDSAAASNQTTEVTYGTTTPTLKISELGYSTAGRIFKGWKVYRSDTKCWRVVDKKGVQSWATTVPDGGDYYLYTDGISVARTANAGAEVHFYAQWEETNSFTVYYHSSDSAATSRQTTEVTYGTTTPTLKVSELGYSTAGRVFKGWKVYRGDTKCWRVVDKKGVQSWATTVPDGGDYYLYTDGISVARTANAGAEVHFYAQWEETNSFTVYYHSSDSAVASKQTTEVTYGTTTPTLKVSELGYSTAGRVFKGWKVYRGDTKCWRVVDKKGVQSWATTVPDGGDYYLYTDGVSVARTANAGAEVHFYAQWEETNSFTVYYHSSDSAAASKQTTEVTYGTTTPTLKVSELGYSTAGRIFKGWKVYRSDTKCWRVVDKKGAQSWATSVPDGGDYYLYTDGISVARTANAGAEVHFYAQWN